MLINSRKGSHSVFSVRLHFVFVTHYRRKAITAPMLERIREMFCQVCKTMDCEMLECSGEPDHVHLLVDFHPKHSISAVAGSLKAATSRLVKKEFPVEFAKWYSEQSFWSGSYYVASSSGAPIEKLKEYVKSQDAPQN
ncbi:MAG: IS200/IS605 family transposase [Chroococcidiopsidaceae cyanobacterium CP_BM_ER_R8_30]|nr:IS200/IS605 family transposase [Chroococcidiopsidaceae cyanobacterium CP_BM_ER_R8_30]